MTIFIRRWLQHEAAGGVLLIIAALIALVMANSPAQPFYEALIHFPQEPTAGHSASFSLLLFINDALMAVFFLMIGLEVKRELMEGALATRRQAAFPAIAAVGGMIVPALIYLLINWREPSYHVGWAIPTATDIAFALGILALLGSRVPANLKTFLLALAIIDDLGAIIIIALFYSHDLSFFALAGAAAAIVALVVMNRCNVRHLGWYLLVGAGLWGMVLLSGVHATLAGVVLGALIPLRLPPKGSTLPENRAARHTWHSPAVVLEHKLQPWVIYMILPLFAFANAGVALQGYSLDDVFSILPMGIVLGLVLGKPLGILTFCLLSIKLGLARLPGGVSFRQISAVSLLCGIGFTMSIFLASLAFGGDNPGSITLAKLGILIGSVLAAVSGYWMLKTSLPR
ncbi:Na+/H+ antiporter NhaA [Acerihabitans sp. TG2]|uniref:Na+/H+ antiporter NhaA n=1 Tax=Acerihabitans sp. TG2 TaxID=3096008 RepID=UPI002B234E03|nr:Na+/H+ antiporter NhaA [Acerihabitans sp. TG2]MEA9392806.1 Na+/H+ antiporter NhaA [Acerihabitans sp. TG2]